jgi:flagellar motor switch/type III secretory pathway protein FliN
VTTESPATHASSAEPAAAASASQQGEDTGSALLVRNESEPVTAAAAISVSTDSPLAGLPLQLDVTVPVPSFRVADLLGLEKGSVLESHWSHVEDVPIWCGGVQLAWTEFEVVNQKLAVRVTRIS